MKSIEMIEFSNLYFCIFKYGGIDGFGLDSLFGLHYYFFRFLILFDFDAYLWV